MAAPTVANFAAQGILNVCKRRGIAASDIVPTTGLDPHLLTEPGTRVPLEAVIALWEQARRSTGDQQFGLHVAESFPFGAYKTYDLLLATAPTIGEALGKASKYNSFVNDAFRPFVVRKRGQIRIEYVNCADPQCNPPEYFEFIFACFMLRFRLTTGLPWHPLEIHFRHSPPRNISEHHRIFQAPVKFRQSATRVFLDESVMRIPQLFADAATNELLENYIQTALRPSSPDDELTAVLHSALRRLLASDQPSLSAAASVLGMSRRSLQRKLAAHSLSYRQVFRSLRCEMALTLLGRGEINTKEAAGMLGFSEPSAFCRAFKKWTGRTFKSAARRPVGPS
ncbi:MAG: AraC family transcriptional regulator [Acidobacteria bacterium]|nr:AraC family transcriptional regulator [Acidobacteriota bacterium]